MNNPKKHHFRPKLYLKGFVFKKQQVYVLDKKTGNIFPNNIKNICYENNFFSFDDDELSIDDKLSLENSLSEVENRVGLILESIRQKQTLAITSPKDFYSLLQWIVWLFVANPTNKRMLNAILKSYFKMPSISLTNSQLIDLFMGDYEKILPFFLNIGWFLGVIDFEDGAFITSDRSINLAGNTLQEPIGVENALCIYFPISPNLILMGIRDKSGFSSKPKKITKNMLVVPNILAYAKAERFVISHSSEILESFNQDVNIQVLPEIILENNDTLIKIINR